MGTLITPRGERHHNNFQNVVGHHIRDEHTRKVPLIRAIPANLSRLSVPISIHFKHKLNHTNVNGDSPSYPVCAIWDTAMNKWNMDDCALAKSNSSHSTCSCPKLGTYALLVDSSDLAAPGSYISKGHLSVTMIIIAIVTLVLVIVFALSVAFFFVYWRNFKV